MGLPCSFDTQDNTHISVNVNPDGHIIVTAPFTQINPVSGLSASHTRGGQQGVGRTAQWSVPDFAPSPT